MELFSQPLFWIYVFIIIGGIFGLILYYTVLRSRLKKWWKARQEWALNPGAQSSTKTELDSDALDERLNNAGTLPPKDPLKPSTATIPPSAEPVPESEISTQEVTGIASTPDSVQPRKDPVTGDDEPTMILPSSEKGIPRKRPGDFVVRLSDGIDAKASEVLSIMRDEADDLLIIYIDGIGYRSLSDQPSVKKRFTALMNELAKTIAQPAPERPDVPAPVVADEAPPTAKHIYSARRDTTSEVSETHVTTEAKAEAPTDAEVVDLGVTDMNLDVDIDDVDDLDFDIDEFDIDAPDLDDLLDLPDIDDTQSETSPPIDVAARTVPPTVQPPPLEDGKMPGDLDLPSLDDELPKKKRGFLGFGSSSEPAKPIPEVNIGEAIEAYLQHKLSYTPAYQGRKIHVHSAPGGGVRIEVDGQFFDAVGDVTDPEVRAFIQATIQEWQERQ